VANATGRHPDGGRAIDEAARGAFGRVDVVVNNAGQVRWRRSPAHRGTASRLDRHAAEALNVSRPAWAVMARRRRPLRSVSSTPRFGVARAVPSTA
jgi:NAD(P)-dependent dehydrogenase (short-subunit alcohol dehydrogenase family)